MAKQTFPMTKRGMEKLQDEQNELQMQRRPQAKQRINHARNFYDFNEDSEYDAALAELAAIDERIVDIQYMIQRAEIIEDTSGPSDTVKIESTVTLQDTTGGEAETYTIVGAEESEPDKGYISHLSPIAESILGAQLHDEIAIQIPNGTRTVRIRHIV